MTPTTQNKILVLLAAVVAIVGVVDSVVDSAWDHLTLFAIILVLLGLMWLRMAGRRPAVPIRADLVAWLDDRAVSSGDSLGTVADRAVSAYRAGLSGSAGPGDDRD